MINDFSEGGLKTIDIESFNKSLKSSWIKKYLDPEIKTHENLVNLFMDISW